ncbi:MAG: B12-binding domain-containing radical SAM protein [Gemmatimonadetes bacterium]|nr:B12-binding domain-containing radical SAM protein [Gemmatimonadota bacterium]
MTKLAMIYPSRTKETHSEELLYSPLALAYLGRHTPAHYDIALYDEYVGEDVDPATLDADIAAFSPITPGIARAYELADALRARGVYCVAGGAHVTALPDEALQHFDTVVSGEGEGPWQQFLRDFEEGAPKPTYFGPMNVDLATLGTPRRDLIHANYQYPSVLTSRGCPYSCSFCYLTAFSQRRYRTIPLETVLEDLDSVSHYPVVIVTDENFIGYSKADRADRVRLLEAMIERRYRFVWGCQTTVTLASDPELMDLMYRAGCRAVFIGFEAVSQAGLKEVNKPQNVGVDYNVVVANLHAHKLAVIASCILGMDAQDKDYPKQLIRAMKEAKADFPRVFFMTAWPGTPLFERLEAEGRASRDWDTVRKDMPSIAFSHFTHDEAMAARKEILDAFFNPWNVLLVISRWVFRDRSLGVLFVKMVVRNRMGERIKRWRVRLWKSGRRRSERALVRAR